MEALARARLDDGADDQAVDDASRFALADVGEKPAGVARRRQVPIGHAARLHHLEHLLEVPQLLPRELRQRGQQTWPVDVSEQHVERCARRFLLAVGVVDQQRIEGFHCGVYPGVGRVTGQERDDEPARCPCRSLGENTEVPLVGGGGTGIELPVYGTEQVLRRDTGRRRNAIGRAPGMRGPACPVSCAGSRRRRSDPTSRALGRSSGLRRLQAQPFRLRPAGTRRRQRRAGP